MAATAKKKKRRKVKKIVLSQPQFDLFTKKYVAHQLGGPKGPSKSVIFQNKRLLVVGLTGSGLKGYKTIDAHEIVPVSQYRGKLKPLGYSAHWSAVNKGKRARCYTGMKITFKKAKWVFTGPRYIFRTDGSGRQLILSFS